MTATGNPRAALIAARDVFRMLPAREPVTDAARAKLVEQLDEALRGQPYPAASLETAACLWEAVLAMQTIGDTCSGDEAQEARGAMIREAQEAMGTSSLRLTVLGWCDAVDAAWAATDTIGGTNGHYDRSFDWDFVPEWIAANVDWSNPHAPTRRRPSPLDALTPDLRKWLVDDLGMRAEIMGGGSFGLHGDGPAGSYVLVTCYGGGGMPDGNSWHVGAYLPDGDADGLLNFTSEHEGRAGMSLEMAVAAARGALADYTGPAAPPSLAFDVSFDMTVNAVVRGVASQEDANAAARHLADRIAATNECLSGADYLAPAVTEFSICDTLGSEGEIQVDALIEDTTGGEG